jgi:hypothetical protein
LRGTGRDSSGKESEKKLKQVRARRAREVEEGRDGDRDGVELRERE